MIGRKLMMMLRFVLAISVLSSMVLTSSAQTCKGQTFNNNKAYISCSDLPYLTSSLHWTYEQSTGKLDIAFRHSSITSTDRWVAWAINKNNDLTRAMDGAQALVAIPQSSGPPKVHTSPISGYSTSLAEGNISYQTTGLSATHQNSEVTIYATVTLPSGTTSLVHVWQDGLMSGSTPQMHATDSANLGSKEQLNLVSGASQGGSSGSSLKRRRNVSGSFS